jgi:large subunit ribosomal protein L35
MPKIKTTKAVSKRFVITKGRKITQRKAGRDHFNARETGKVVRHKRCDFSTDKSLDKTIKSLMPYA